MKAYIDAVAKKLQQFEFLTYGLIITPLPPKKNRKVREKSSKQASKGMRVYERVVSCVHMRARTPHECFITSGILGSSTSILMQHFGPRPRALRLASRQATRADL